MFTGNSKEAKLARTGLAVGIFWVLGRRLGVFAHPGRWGMGILVVALLGSLVPKSDANLAAWANTQRAASISSCESLDGNEKFSEHQVTMFCRCVYTSLFKNHLGDDTAKFNMKWHQDYPEDAHPELGSFLPSLIADAAKECSGSLD
jgi:hypothetical protein